jgi:hypothetical protein
MGEKEQLPVRALRIREGVELPEFSLDDKRCLAVSSDEPYASDEDYALAAIAFVWHTARLRGWNEDRLRPVLRRDPKLAPWANVKPLPEFKATGTLSRAEAAVLIDEGLAEPIEEQ